MKIVYVIDSLASKGGAERTLCDKMNYMTLNYNYEVYVITCYQNVEEQPNAYYLTERVKQINLNIPYYFQYRFSYPKRLWMKWKLYRKLRKTLSDTVIHIDPDVLIGLGYFNADMVTSISCKASKIVESHEARMFTMSDKGLGRSVVSRIFMRCYRVYYFNRVEKQADCVITLTTGDAQEWKKAKRVEVIPNFTLLPVAHHSLVKEKRVLSVGRLEWQKGFDRLLKAWKLVEEKHPDWRLDIFGSGTLDAELRAQISQEEIHRVEIRPFTSNIAEQYAQSSIFVLCSRFEGFGLVLIEAMKTGLPCVVFDCPFGPSDVVVDGECGYVVPEGDIKLFANRLSILIEDENVRNQFSKASIEREKNYNPDEVMSKYKLLVEQLANNKVK